jgi:myo-inositol-1(or 4)-monophosphatase
MKSEKSFWVLDPIDGTTNYLRAYPFFCSTIAFVTNENSKFVSQVGATWNPVSQEMFSASRGGGAFLNRQQLKVADITDPKSALLVTGFASGRSQDSHRPFELFEKITKQTLGVRRDGSAALDLAYVAAGRLDAYWEYGLSPWDIAAGALMVEEAGGKVTSLDNESFKLETGEILASNSGLHKWLVDQVKG